MLRVTGILLIALLAAAVFGAPSSAAERDLASDTWTATDALGRTLPGFEECGPPREGKVVGLFYFIWLGQHSTSGPHDISRITAENPDDPQWGPVHHFHHWSEPELGYYVSTEEWVIRHHARMLANAGVDVIIFDVTNSFTYGNAYMKLCEVYARMRSEGWRTPSIAFIAHSHEERTVERLYEEFYSRGLHRDLWFIWRGKPLILANPEKMREDLRDFFTFRHSWAWSNPGGWFGDGRDKWPWLDNWPQTAGWYEEGIPEQVSVSAAQHPTSNIGRSHRDNRQPPPEEFRSAEGLYFAQQWDRALEIDPQFIFITGWNEWVAQRFIADGKGIGLLGRRLDAGESFFVDQYDQEYSRDIEPMKGGHTDSYYYQMVANIRRFKGVREPERASGPKTIRIDGRFADWTLVRPEYRDWIGDAEHRDSAGWNESVRLVNTSGRNDIVRLKAACDSANVYFYAETKDDISPTDGPDWMRLLIDSDCDPKTGWMGYDFQVSGGELKSLGGERGTDGTRVSYRTDGKRMELAVPRSALGMEGRRVRLDFHWADNAPLTDDINAFALSGDHAPDRRFNYRFEER